MPMYQFSCEKCEHQEDFILPVDKRDISQDCSKCKGVMKRNVSGALNFRLGVGSWERNGYTETSQSDLDDALREHDYHQKNHDNMVEQETKAGMY